jgi:GNAT superfamily N-acetyltransferase
MTTLPTFIPVDLVRDRTMLLDLNVEYMSWNSVELERHFNISVADAVGMPIREYVEGMLDKVCGDQPPHGRFYLVEHDGAVAGMGGMREIAPGIAELKRVYIRREWRGNGLGAAIIDHLLGDARQFGFHTMRLDSGPFMTSAHRLYEAAGFVYRDPYPGAEVPAMLHPVWRFMESDLGGKTFPQSAER